MSDGGGARATVELLLHIHSFKNIDLRSRGHFCVEVVAFPQSCPKSPGVPFRTYCDPSARRSAARGVMVAPVDGDELQPGFTATSAAGLPSYTSSLLPIRFTNEKVQLSEGASFRVHLDADWLETDVIVVEFRLMYRAIPDSSGSAGDSESAPSEETPPPEALKQVGIVTLHAKCATAKGGLHRYHPLVFSQPYLCVLDVTFHMALTAINHPGGPAGIAAAIAGNAFPSEETHPAPRGPISPSTPTGNRTQARSASVGRLSHGSRGAEERPATVRPRFQTPGRFRRRVYGSPAVTPSSSSGWGGAATSALVPSSPSSRPLRPRVAMTPAALEAAGSAIGLATALGCAPATLDSDQGEAAQTIYRAAELLYSRHALGLKWSQGTLAVAEAAATAAAAEAAAAAVGVAEKALAAAKSRGTPFSKSTSATGDIGAPRSQSSSSIFSNGRPAESNHAVATRVGERPVGYSSDGGSGGGSGLLGRRNSTNAAAIAPSSGGHRYRRHTHVLDGERSKGKPPTSTGSGSSSAAAPASDGQAGGVRAGRLGNSNGKGKGMKMSMMERVDMDEAEATNDPWTWEGVDSAKEGGGKGNTKGKTLPSDVRQLSRVIHIRLKEASKVCSRSWASFAAATFECGRRGMYMLREEWVRETQRAWSGQCLENLSLEREDLLTLDETLLDPDGFIPLRARAGIRLRRRASPTRGGLRKRLTRDNYTSRASSVTPSSAPPPLLGNGPSHDTGRSAGGCSGCNTKETPRMITNGSSWREREKHSRRLESMSVDEADDRDINDDLPPLLDPLERRLSHPLLPGGRSGGGSGPFDTPQGPGSHAATSCRNKSSAWGGGSSTSSVLRVDGQGSGWFSKLSAAAGGSSPTTSIGSISTAGNERERGSGPLGLVTGVGMSTEYALSAMAMHFPPPPMSLLAIFNRDLHGYDAEAANDEKWADLPFVVVESWGGVELEEMSPSDEKDSSPDGSVSSTSPVLDKTIEEYKRFQRIASGTFARSPTNKMAIEAAAANGVSAAYVNGNGNGSKVIGAGSHVICDQDTVFDDDGDEDEPGRVHAMTRRNQKGSPPPPYSTASTTAASLPNDEDDDEGPPRLPDLIPTPSMSKSNKPATVGVTRRLSPRVDGGSGGIRSPRSGIPRANHVSAAVSAAPKGSPIRMTFGRQARSRSFSRSPSLNYSTLSPDSPFSAADSGSSTSRGPASIQGNKLLKTPARARRERSLSSPASIFSSVGDSGDGDGPLAGSRRSSVHGGGLRSPVVTKVGMFGTPARVRAASTAAAAAPSTSSSPVGVRVRPAVQSPGNVAGILTAATPPRPRASRVTASGKPAMITGTPPRAGIATPPRAPRSPPGNDCVSGGDKTGSIWDETPASKKKKLSKTSGRLRSMDEKGKRKKHRRPVRQASLPQQAVANGGSGMWDTPSSGRSATSVDKSTKLGLLARAESLASDFHDGVSSSDNDSAGGRGLAKRTQGKKRRKSKRAIRRKMWGRRPEWATELLADQQTGGASDAASAAANGSGRMDERVAAAVAAASAAASTATPAPESGANHLVVLVHGLGGRPADMALLRGFLQTLMPGAEMMVATSLQEVRKENSGVEALGRKLADEVDAHIQRFCPCFGTSPSAASTAQDESTLPLSPVTPMRTGRGGKKKKKESGVYGNVGTSGTRREGSRRNSKGGNGGRAENKGILSFVCFSMGGLVARSALLESAMVPYLDHLHCFVTLACPHLGQTSTPLSFFKTGAWAFRKLTGLRVLHELDLDDADDPRETALYRLSFSPGLERFRTIVFAANPRDGFVPLHSASVRLAPPGMDSSDSRTKKASAEMAEMLMSKVNERKNRVVRITVDDPRRQGNSKSMVESVIGRAGHMCFIDSPQVAWLISLALLPFMEETVPRRS